MCVCVAGMKLDAVSFVPATREFSQTPDESGLEYLCVRGQPRLIGDPRG